MGVITQLLLAQAMTREKLDRKVAWSSSLTIGDTERQHQHQWRNAS
jgi:hypothetical protein